MAIKILFDDTQAICIGVFEWFEKAQNTKKKFIGKRILNV